MQRLSDIGFVLLEVMRLAVALLLARDTVRIETTLHVRAPRERIWDLLTSERGRLEGTPAVELAREPLDADTGVYQTTTQVGSVEMQSVYRVLSVEPLTAQRAQMLAVFDGSETQQATASHHEFGFHLEAGEEGTRVVSFHELSGWHFADALALALSTRMISRRIKETCEREAGRAAERRSGQASSAHPIVEHKGFEINGEAVNVCFGFTCLTLILCGAFVGVGQAAIFLSALLWYGFSVTAARGLCGRETPVIGLLPFAWQFATRELDETPAEVRICHALLSGLISLVPGVMLAVVYAVQGDVALGSAAAIFAAVSVLHMAPLLPFEGGHVAAAVTSMLPARLRGSFHFGLLAVACFVGVTFDAYLAGFLIALGAFQLSAWCDGLLVLEVPEPGEGSDTVDRDVIILGLAGFGCVMASALLLVANLVNDNALWPMLSGLLH